MRLRADTAAYACREYYKVELTGYRRVPRRRMVQETEGDLDGDRE